MKIRKSRFGLNELYLHLNYQIQNRNKYQCNCLDFIIAHGFMHQCVNVNICNFAIFGPVFVKFSSNCRANEMGMLFTILGSFCVFFLERAGANIWQQNRPRKIPGLVYSNVLSSPA